MALKSCPKSNKSPNLVTLLEGMSDKLTNAGFQYFWSVSSDSNGTVKDDLSKKDSSMLKLSAGSLQGGSVYNFSLTVIVEQGMEIKDEFFLNHSESANFKKTSRILGKGSAHEKNRRGVNSTDRREHGRRRDGGNETKMITGDENKSQGGGEGDGLNETAYGRERSGDQNNATKRAGRFNETLNDKKIVTGNDSRVNGSREHFGPKNRTKGNRFDQGSGGSGIGPEGHGFRNRTGPQRQKRSEMGQDGQNNEGNGEA